MQRLSRSIMTSAAKRVPIPKNGVDYRGKIVLAPMVRSGEIPSRITALKYGADLVWGPETVDRSMIGTTRKVNTELSTIDFTRYPSNGSRENNPILRESVIYRIHPELEGKKTIFQIGTSDPERAVAAARLVAADVAGIDVNAGCPKPFSTSGGMGAALLQTPDKLASILSALVENIVPEFEIGISVKIRLLETPARTEALVRKLVATGITALTVHCRTTPMRPRERAIRDQLKMIVDVCHEAGVACVMNGDVESREQAVQLMEEFGADGAMIATAAEKNPSVFRTQEQGGMAPWEEIVEEYFKNALLLENRWGNTKFLLCNHIPGKSPKHQAITASKCYVQACKALGFETLEQRAKEVDDKLEITPIPKENTQGVKKAKQKNKSAKAAGGNMGKSGEKKQSKQLSQRGVSSPTKSSLDAKPLVV